jgi:hypothetical protein
LLEVTRDIADKEVLAWREVDAAGLCARRIDVVAVADQLDAGALLFDVAGGIRRIRGGFEVALEYEKLVRRDARVRDRKIRLAGLDRAGNRDLPLGEADGHAGRR